MEQVNNIRIRAFTNIATPDEVVKKVPLTRKARETVINGRQALRDILDEKDGRKIIVAGPCSIHNYEEALEYAEKFNKLCEKVKDKMVIVMRVYFEKPRTTIGWKGFVYDPFLDDSYSLDKGVAMARKLLVKINEMGLPCGTEVLGPIIIQYYADLICWSAIGARTAESQTHRELASGLSMPVGFKNGTEGNVDIALNAILSARAEHHFLGMDDTGKVTVVETLGNPYGHVILRGGKDGPNYSEKNVAKAGQECKQAGLPARIFVDCSHANSNKDFRNQAKVWESVWKQIARRPKSIMGVMLESNINEGSQQIAGGWGELKHGVSVTDACIGFRETERLILSAYKGFSL